MFRQFARKQHLLHSVVVQPPITIPAVSTLNMVIATFSAKAQLHETKDPVRSSVSTVKNTADTTRKEVVIPQSYRFAYREFLPDPTIEWRNAIREKLERIDMLNRRSKVEIPEFYVGSILAVTSSDPHAPGKVSRFVGICIHRDRCGLYSRFILRNVIDHQGVEILYDCYDPTIIKFEILRLEKRLDDHLLYLRDANPEYSTFDINMSPVSLEEDSPIPINTTKVVLRPRPWLERWERQNLQGIANIDEYLTDKRRRTAKEHEKPWAKFDLMKQYRSTIPEEEQKEIFAEIHSQLHHQEQQRRRKKRKSSFLKPNKLA